MNRSNRILLLRISYWTGAIADGFTVIPMLFPSFGKLFLSIENFNPIIEYKYAIGVAASLMIGWPILLIWANQKPLDRRGVIWIALLVMLGLFLTSLFGLKTGFIQLVGLIPQWCIMGVVASLFLSGLYVTREFKSLEVS